MSDPSQQNWSPRGQQYLPVASNSGTPEHFHQQKRNPAVKCGAELQREIRDTQLAFGQAALWWLGQASFCIKLGHAIVYIDPFFRSAEQQPPTLQETPLKPHEFTDAAAICCTHEHYDHLDALTLPGAAAASPLARIVFPESVRNQVSGMNIPHDRLKGMRGDDTFVFNGIKIHALPAAHMDLDFNPQCGFRYLGYVLEGNGVTIYHTGDTQPYEGWSSRVNRFALDVSLLPISGRDNLHWQQAVYFCANHRPRVAIPMHYGMFAKYTENPLIFAEALSRNVPQQTVQILQVGEAYRYAK